MQFSQSLIALVASCLAVASAAPAFDVLPRGIAASACGNPVKGLSTADCNHMQKIGFAQQGMNSYSPNGKAWIGGQGPNTFAFKNDAGVDVTLVMWQLLPGDYQAMCMNARQGLITYSIPKGQSVTISIANGVSGAFAGLYNRVSNLNNVGQVNNVWGEFTTGNYATVDVSREINMSGNHMSIKVQKTGCVSEWTKTSSRCAFMCTGGALSCLTGYTLDNCANGSQQGATFGTYGGAASGGCQGFNNGGHVDVSFLE